MDAKQTLMATRVAFAANVTNINDAGIQRLIVQLTEAKSLR